MEQQEVITAVIKVGMEYDPTVQALVQEVTRIKDYAINRIILNESDLTPATEDLALISKVKKALTEKKNEYLKPIKAHVDTLNNAFTLIMNPLEEADRVTRSKILSFRAEQERKAKEAEEINRQKEELARREAAFNGTGEVTIDTTPVIVPAVAPAHVRTDVGTLGTAHITKWEVIDLALVPRDYLMVDTAKIGAVVRASKGTIAIPGIRIWQEETVKVNTK